jgi:hypothetical protein
VYLSSDSSSWRCISTPETTGTVYASLLGRATCYEIHIVRAPKGFNIHQVGVVLGSALHNDKSVWYKNACGEKVKLRQKTGIEPAVRSRAVATHPQNVALEEVVAACRALGIRYVRLVAAGMKTKPTAFQLAALQHGFDMAREQSPDRTQYVHSIKDGVVTEIPRPYPAVMRFDLARDVHTEDIVLFGIKDQTRKLPGWRVDTNGTFGLTGAVLHQPNLCSAKLLPQCEFGTLQFEHRWKSTVLCAPPLREDTDTHRRRSTALQAGECRMVNIKIYQPSIHVLKPELKALIASWGGSISVFNDRLDKCEKLIARRLLHTLKGGFRVEVRYVTLDMRELPLGTLSVEYLARTIGVIVKVRDMISRETVVRNSLATMVECDRRLRSEGVLDSHKGGRTLTAQEKNWRRGKMRLALVKIANSMGFNPGVNEMNKIVIASGLARGDREDYVWRQEEVKLPLWRGSDLRVGSDGEPVLVLQPDPEEEARKIMMASGFEDLFANVHMRHSASNTSRWCTSFKKGGGQMKTGSDALSAAIIAAVEVTKRGVEVKNWRQVLREGTKDNQKPSRNREARDRQREENQKLEEARRCVADASAQAALTRQLEAKAAEATAGGGGGGGGGDSDDGDGGEERDAGDDSDNETRPPPKRARGRQQQQKKKKPTKSGAGSKKKKTAAAAPAGDSADDDSDDEVAPPKTRMGQKTKRPTKKRPGGTRRKKKGAAAAAAAAATAGDSTDGGSDDEVVAPAAKKPARARKARVVGEEAAAPALAAAVAPPAKKKPPARARKARVVGEVVVEEQEAAAAALAAAVVPPAKKKPLEEKEEEGEEGEEADEEEDDAWGEQELDDEPWELDDEPWEVRSELWEVGSELWEEPEITESAKRKASAKMTAAAKKTRQIELSSDEEDVQNGEQADMPPPKKGIAAVLAAATSQQPAATSRQPAAASPSRLQARGLYNLRSVCYMNAALQGLLSLGKLCDGLSGLDAETLVALSAAANEEERMVVAILDAMWTVYQQMRSEAASMRRIVIEAAQKELVQNTVLAPGFYWYARQHDCSEALLPMVRG